MQRTTNDASLEVIRMNFQGEEGMEEEEEKEERSSREAVGWNFSLFISPRHPSLVVLDGASRETWRERGGEEKENGEKWEEWISPFGFIEQVVRNFGFADFLFPRVNVMVLTREEDIRGGRGEWTKEEVLFPLLEILEMG